MPARASPYFCSAATEAFEKCRGRRTVHLADTQRHAAGRVPYRAASVSRQLRVRHARRDPRVQSGVRQRHAVHARETRMPAVRDARDCAARRLSSPPASPGYGKRYSPSLIVQHATLPSHPPCWKSSGAAHHADAPNMRRRDIIKSHFLPRFFPLRGVQATRTMMKGAAIAGKRKSRATSSREKQLL